MVIKRIIILEIKGFSVLCNVLVSLVIFCFLGSLIEAYNKFKEYQLIKQRCLLEIYSEDELDLLICEKNIINRLNKL